MNLIWLLVGDLVLLALLILTTVGIINAIGFLGLNINAQIVNYALTIFVYSILLNLIINRDLSLNTSSKLSDEWINSVNSLKSTEIKYYLLIGSTLVAFLAIKVDLLLLCIALAFVILYSMSVSYTHLDVYKRQWLEWWRWTIRRILRWRWRRWRWRSLVKVKVRLVLVEVLPVSHTYKNV